MEQVEWAPAGPSSREYGRYGGKTQAPRFQVAQASRRSHPVVPLSLFFFTPRKFCGTRLPCSSLRGSLLRARCSVFDQ